MKGTNFYKGPNKVRHLSNGTTELVLERNAGRHMICIIDTSDYKIVRPYRWSAGLHCTQFYAITNLPRAVEGPRQLRMHVLLTGAKGFDHADRNGLNNRRGNLREATWQQQRLNCRKVEYRRGKPVTSKYRGVCWHVKARKFMARIVAHGRFEYLGIYDNQEDAARAYNKAAVRLHGEFASLNEVNQ